jgi:DNA-binding Xre family transcriptional regulator
MTMKNRIKPFVDGRGISVYQFRKDTGIANKTAYDLYNNPDQYLGRNVMDAICRVYNVQPGDLLEYVPEDEEVTA